MVADSCPSLDRMLRKCHIGHVVCTENSIEGKSPIGWADYHRKRTHSPTPFSVVESDLFREATKKAPPLMAAPCVMVIVILR